MCLFSGLQTEIVNRAAVCVGADMKVPSIQPLYKVATMKVEHIAWIYLLGRSSWGKHGLDTIIPVILDSLHLKNV